MDTKTLEELDFYRIRQTISGYCLSQEGKETFLKTEPLTNIEKIESRKKLCQEWLTILSSVKQNPLSSWPPVNTIIKILQVNGASLSLEQLYHLSQFCNAVQKVSQELQNAKTQLNTQSLAKLAEDIPNLIEPITAISKIITADGELKDLPQLRAIRTKIANLNSKIKSIMHKYTSDSKYSDILESTVPVLRGGRQVLAVRTNKRSSIQGIIHEVSQSGQTVYIEPDEAVMCSNELIQAEFELLQETKKILQEVTFTLSKNYSDFTKSLSIMKILDCTYASASWGKEFNCIYPPFIENEPLQLVQARHPLLKEKAVPIDVNFLEGKRILIITGPNTGGKTVTLKTIALFSLMNQAGFPIPCAEGTKLPYFTKVFADIGDEQSLDQSLSTFSGHMKNIARAIKNVDSKSLVLLDEFGSGTDPQEGAGISMAILDKLIEKNAFVLITTHQGVLKNYGYTHSECINASVEFNSQTLSPTYKIIMGVPGESHALEIAQKSGIPKEIIAKAKNYISTEKTNVSSLIKGLSKKHSELNKLQEAFKLKEIELQEKQHKNELKSLSLQEKEHQLKLGIQKESQEFLQQSRKELENLVRKIKEGEITREKTLNVKKFISDLTEKINKNEEALQKEEELLLQEQERIQKEHKKYTSNKPNKKQKLKNSQALKFATPLTSIKQNQEVKENLEYTPGAIVFSKSLNKEGSLIHLEKKGYWQVQFGSIKITLKEKDLELKSSPKEFKPTVDYDTNYETENNKPLFELRLLGMRSQEAIKALEQQLDLCAIHNFKNFSIIHGKGNGILQQAVQDYLSNYPAVKEFCFAPPEDGGSGKTYVTLA